MSSNKKTLKMERLSPIPALDWNHLLSDPLRTPVQPAMAPSHRRQKDAYAIETTSSPEFGKIPVATSSSCLQKQRKYRNIARGKVPKKTSSTPLSGLISRKTFNSTSKEAVHLSVPYSSCTSNVMPSPSEASLVNISQEIPQIDDYSPQKPFHSPHHAEIISASTIFPQKPVPSTSNTTPLAGMVNKKVSNLNLSLNDSIMVLREAEDPSDDDEEMVSNTSLPNIFPKSHAEKVNIESFESPRKPHFVFSKERTTSASIFKNFCPYPSKNLVKDNPSKASPVIVKSNSKLVEMCGNERKNRKRALDFNSSTFMVPVTSDDVGNDGRRSPVLRFMSPCREPVDAPSREQDCQSPSLNLSSPKSPILIVTPLCQEGVEDRQSPILNIELPKSPVLNLMPPLPQEPLFEPLKTIKGLENKSSAEKQEVECPSDSDSVIESTPRPSNRSQNSGGFTSCSRQSPILNLTSPGHDCRSPIVHFMPPCEGKEDRRSPILNLVPPSHDCRSPILNIELPQSPVLNLMPPLPQEALFEPLKTIKFRENKSSAEKQEVECPSESDSVIESTSRRSNKNQSSAGFTASSRQSPILNLTSTGHDCPSQILNLMPPCECEEDRQSPLLNLESRKSPVLNLMPPLPQEALFEPLKTTKFLENKSFTDEQEEECPSESDSVIESTPRPSENRNQSSGGFTASSCFKIENDSPPSTNIKTGFSAEDFEIPKIVEILEETSDNKNKEKRDLKFVVVSHDTSSDESDVEQATKNSCHVTIEGRHSPHLELNYTKRPIQSFESPSKASKPFSEAVNIGAFGSPDSIASYGDHPHEEEEKGFGTDEVLEPSTTQEYIEESEQVRPTKRRKKGSLLERVRGVIAKVDASNALFDYEIKCGLRPTTGKFVTAPLVILKKSGEISSLFLVCKPLKYCKNSSHVEDISSFVAVHVNKLPPGVSEGSVVLLHLPVNVMYFSNLKIPCVLVGHQIVSHPTEPKIDVCAIDASSLESIHSFSSVYSKPITSFRTFSSAQTRTLSEAALCQNLVEESNLYLTVLHVTKLYAAAILKKMMVLCCDEEFQTCWLEFKSERDIKRATALATLNVLADGFQVQTKGFSVIDRFRLDRKSKYLISYCSNNIVNNEIIFSVHPKESNWVISSTECLREVKKVPSLIVDIVSKKMLGRRYLIEVHGVDNQSQTTVKDSQGQSIYFAVGENSCVNLEQPVPFFLDGVYFYDGKLFSDEHTRVVQTI